MLIIVCSGHLNIGGKSSRKMGLAATRLTTRPQGDIKQTLVIRYAGPTQAYWAECVLTALVGLHHVYIIHLCDSKQTPPATYSSSH